MDKVEFIMGSARPTFKIAICPKCKKGRLFSMGINSLVKVKGPALIQHQCENKKCNNIEGLRREYPLFFWDCPQLLTEYDKKKMEAAAILERNQKPDE